MSRVNHFPFDKEPAEGSRETVKRQLKQAHLEGDNNRQTGTEMSVPSSTDDAASRR